MRMSERGTLIVYSGPSGVGKGTLLQPYLAAHPQARLSVSVTTRDPRPGEVDGIHYWFITQERFDRLVAEGGLLEHASYSAHSYGTPRAQVEEQLAQGRDVILEIEVQGAMQIKRSFPDAVFVFILPPSLEELRRRLSGRGTEPPQVVEARLAAAIRELEYAKEYDYLIVNDDLQRAEAKLEAVIAASKCRAAGMLDYVERMVHCCEHA